MKYIILILVLFQITLHAHLGRVEYEDEETPATREENSFSDFLVAFDHFLSAIHFDSRFPKTDRCIKNNEPLAVMIGIWIRRVIKVETVEKLIAELKDFYEKLYPLVEEAIIGCQSISKEVKENFKRIKAIVTQPDYVLKLFENAKKNSVLILTKIVGLRTSYQQKKYDQVGTYLGDVFMLIFKL